MDQESFYEELLKATVIEETQEYANSLFITVANDADKINWILQNAIKYKDTKVIQFLLSSGIDINRNAIDIAIHSAVHNESFDLSELLLLHCGSEINFVDYRGLTHFHVACIVGNATYVKNFLLNGVNPNLPCTYGDISTLTPLCLAVEFLRIDIVELLLNFRADPNIKDGSGRTALHLICQGKIQRFHELPSIKHWSMIQLHQLELMELLLEHGSDVNARDHLGNTPILSIFHDDFIKRLGSMDQHFIGDIDNKHHLVSEFRKTQREKINLLMTYKADFTILNNRDESILYLAIKDIESSRKPRILPNLYFYDDEHVQLVRQLLKTKVNVNAKNKNGESPVYLAVSLLSYDIVKILLDYDADVESVKFYDDCFHYYENIVPCFEATENLLKIIQELSSRGFKLSQRDNLIILKFFVRNSSECVYANPEDDDASFKLKNLLELGDGMNITTALEEFPVNLNDTSYNAQTSKKNILQQLQDHIKIVNTGNLYVGDRVNDCLKLKISKLEKSLLKILFSDRNSNQLEQQKYNSEIQKMKDTMLNPYTSIHDVLKVNPHKAYRKIKSCNYESVLKSHEFIIDFPHSAGIIKGHFAKSLVRTYVSRSANDYFKLLINRDFPELCCQNIVKYLNNDNLMNLCLAASR